MNMKTIALCAGVMWPGMAMADAIDGDWCAPDQLQRVNIEGPKITLSSGTEVAGTYTRHEFVYVVPDGEPGEGTQVYMRQLSEEDVEVHLGEANPELWHRCQAVVS